MTCIVGYAKKGVVWIGGDSLVSDGWIEWEQSTEESKVFKRNNILFGVSGGCRQAQLLKFTLAIPDRKENQDDNDYLYNSLCPSILKCLKDNDAVAIKDNVAKASIGIVIGYKGKLYTMCTALSLVKPQNPYCAEGSGYLLALGSMHTIESNALKLDPVQKITQSLEAASKFCPGVGGHFDILKLGEIA